MTKITENDIEQFAIELLEKQGFSYLYGPEIAPDSDNPMRDSFDDVLLEGVLKAAIDRINPSIPTDARTEALSQVKRINSPELMTNNETFHRFLTEGVNVTFRDGSEDRGNYVWLIDFDNLENNEFHLLNQFTITHNQQNKRPDVILFVNGLPLVVMELKNAVDEHATVTSAFWQIQTYKETIPALFTYNSICVISDGLEARGGSVSAGLSRFMMWKSEDGQQEA